MYEVISSRTPFQRACLGLVATAIASTALLGGCYMNVQLDTDGPEVVKAQLKAQADAWDKAIERKDRAAIEANMADDFRNIDSNGSVLSAKTFVDELVDPDFRMNPMTVDDFEVRLYENVALLSGRTLITGTYAGKPFTSHFRYIDIYVKRGGNWKLVSVQTTRIAKK